MWINKPWLDEPDEFESQGANWHIEIIPINKITGIGWATNETRKSIEKAWRNNQKVPLVLIEKLEDGPYELQDGQHRFAAYKRVFPNAKRLKAAVFTRGI